jgi:AraC-like DNA-binding protein
MSPQMRFEAWRQALNDTFFPLRVLTDDLDKESAWLLHPGSVGHLVTAYGEAGPQRMCRSARMAAADDNDQYAIALILDGRGFLTQEGREAVLAPGEFALYDCTRPFELSWDTAHRTIAVSFERKRLNLKPADTARLTARTMSSRSGLGALLGTTLSQLAHDPTAYGHDVATRVSTIALETITTFFTHKLSQLPEPEPADRVRLRQIRRYIDSHLHDPDLTLQSVAAAHFVSLRHLHKLFAQEELTAARWILTRRLERCRDDLADPLLRSRSVSDIAIRNGLNPGPHFSHSFRRQFGLSPSDCRQLGPGAPSAGSGRSVREVLRCARPTRRGS